MVLGLKNEMKDIGGHIRMYGYDQPSRSEHKGMEMQNNPETIDLQQEQPLSRAAKLQCRWLEVSERERQAHIYNRQLLQDFHKAQDTINDLMARTAAMNTLRVEYEKHLEQLYPQWRQKLQEQRLSTQRKRLEMHLREFMTQMDDESPEAVSSNSASHSVPSSSQSNKRQEGPNQRPRNTHGAERFNKPKAVMKQNNSNPNGFPQLPYTWLTQINHPIPRSDQIVTEPRGAHYPHAIPPPPLNLPLRGDAYNSYGTVYQEPPIAEDDLRENPPYPQTWAGVGEGPTVPQAQPNPYGSWPPAGLPMLNPAVWRMMSSPVPRGEDIHSSQGVGGGGSVGRGGGRGGGGSGDRNRDRDRGPVASQPPRSPGRGPSPRQSQRMGANDRTSDRTCELDTKPVRLSGADDESSAGSSTTNRSKNKRKEGKGSQRSAMVEREDTISQQSSAVSQASLMPNLRHEVLSRNTNIAESSSESAEQTHSVSRRSKTTNGTQIGPNKVSLKASRENVSIASSKQSGKSQVASIKTQAQPQEPTDDETEENAPSVRSDRATGGEDEDEDERLTDNEEDEQDEEEQRNKGMVGERVNKGEGAEQEQSEEEEDDNDEEEEGEEEGEEEEKEEAVEVFRLHSGQLNASKEAVSDKALSNGSQKSQHANSKKNGTKSSEMVKETDKSQSKDKPSEEEDDDNEDDDDDDDDNDEEQQKEEEEDDGGGDDDVDGGDDDDEEEEDDEDDEGDSKEEAPQPKSAITKEKSISNRNNAVNIDNQDDEDDEDEEMYNQEIEDDEEDEVVVDNGYTRTEGQKYNFLRFLDEKDEDEDDIESLLAPKKEVPKQKEMIPKVIVIQKGSESDSDEVVLQKKKSSPMAPAGKEISSDDEFDHFYD